MRLNFSNYFKNFSKDTKGYKVIADACPLLYTEIFLNLKDFVTDTQASSIIKGHFSKTLTFNEAVVWRSQLSITMLTNDTKQYHIFFRKTTKLTENSNSESVAFQ